MPYQNNQNAWGNVHGRYVGKGGSTNMHDKYWTWSLPGTSTDTQKGNHTVSLGRRTLWQATTVKAVGNTCRTNSIFTSKRSQKSTPSCTSTCSVYYVVLSRMKYQLISAVQTRDDGMSSNKRWCRKLYGQLLICRRISDKINVRPIMFFSRRRHADHLCWRRRYFPAKGSCHADKDLRLFFDTMLLYCQGHRHRYKIENSAYQYMLEMQEQCRCGALKRKCWFGTNILNRGWKKMAYMKVWPSKSLERVH